MTLPTVGIVTGGPRLTRTLAEIRLTSEVEFQSRERSAAAESLVTDTCAGELGPLQAPQALLTACNRDATDPRGQLLLTSPATHHSTQPGNQLSVTACVTRSSTCAALDSLSSISVLYNLSTNHLANLWPSANPEWSSVVRLLFAACTAATKASSSRLCVGPPCVSFQP